MLIRFALMVHSQSPAAYRTLRKTGVLTLPGETTLKDYTNVFPPKSGIQLEVFEELKKLADKLEPNRSKLMSILIYKLY